MRRLCETCNHPNPKFAGRKNIHCVNCEMIIHKRCRCCREEKKLSQFYVAHYGDGRETVCSACVRQGLVGGYCWECMEELDPETVGKNARYCLQHLEERRQHQRDRRAVVIPVDHHKTPIADLLRRKW